MISSGKSNGTCQLVWFWGLYIYRNCSLSNEKVRAIVGYDQSPGAGGIWARRESDRLNGRDSGEEVDNNVNFLVSPLQKE